MRSVSSFTDGRIHVTLCEGAYDLQLLDLADRGAYARMLELWAAPGLDLGCWESLWRGVGLTEFGLALRLRARPVLRTLYYDLCRRLVLEALELQDEASRMLSRPLAWLREQMVPWRPVLSRQLFDEVVGDGCAGESEGAWRVVGGEVAQEWAA